MNGQAQAAQQEMRPPGEDAATVVSVRAAGEADVETAAVLFRGYLDFYEVDIEDPDAPRAFLAERIA